MKKTTLLLRATFLLLFMLSGKAYIIAQDSTKATAVKPVVKPAAKVYTTKPGGATYYKKPYQAKPVGAQPSATTAGSPAAIQPVVQTPVQTPVSTDKSLGGQYQYVLSKTYRYQQPMIAALWKNVTDSLNAAKKDRKVAEAKLASQTQSIAALQNDAKTKEQTASNASAQCDGIDLFGISLSKTAYNLLMWGLVAGMAAVVGVVILKTSGATREAKYRIKLYNEVSEEFTAFKAKAKDKEMKLARELQTERNKVDELMGRG